VGGQQVHGSMPWLGRDPMPAAAGIIGGIGQLYRQVAAWDPVTVSIGHVADEGRFNIIGASVTLWGTIRCLVDADMADVQARLRRLAEGHAAAYGCSAEVEYLQPVPAVVNTPAWMEATLPTLRRVAGDANVIEAPPDLGYDDVSVFVARFGGVYLTYGVQDTRVAEGPRLVPVEGGRGMVPNHHPAFYADDDSLIGGVRVHAHVAVDHLGGAITLD
jgi:metal-dependent amidase/aminoacylase/carboxypeptidase family protein